MSTNVEFENPVVLPITDELKLEVRTVRTAWTGISAHIHVYNGKLLFSDEVKLSQDKERSRFSKQLAMYVPDVDQDSVREALLELIPKVEKELRETQQAEAALAGAYEERPDGLYWHKQTKDGFVPTRLSQFTARIITDIIEDDGESEERFLEIEANLVGQTGIACS